MHCPSTRSRHAVERIVWWSNDVIEAFANAMTPANPNSSRMALAVKLTFTSAGILCGGHLSGYNLEARRVFLRDMGDRNFHIFFQVGGALHVLTLSTWRQAQQ
jgi:myosin heavy subunit